MQNSNPHSATNKVVPSECTCGYGWAALFFILLFTSSIIVTSLAPMCQTPAVTVTYGRWYRPAYCDLGINLGISNVVFAVVWAPLTLAGLSMLSNKTPAEVNNNQFSCLFIWALILCGISVFLALYEALGVTLSPSRGIYTCSVWIFFSTNCSPAFEAWIQQAENASVPHKTYLTFVAWVWLLYTIVGIIVPSRTKYWCCPDCKKTCPQAAGAREDDCGTCVCCLGDIPDTKPPQTAVAMTGGPPVALVAGGQPMVAQPVQMQPQMTEVQYWLTYEIGLPAYAPIFIQQGYTHLQSLLFNVNNEQDLRRIVPTIDPNHVAPMLNNLNAKRQAAQGYMANSAAPPAGQGYAPTGYEGGMTQQT